MVEASDHVYVWPQTYTCHTYSFMYRSYFLPANPCDTYKSAVRHIHDPMLVPKGRNYTCNFSGSASEVVGACCCISIFRFNRYLLEYSAFFCFLTASRLVSAILVVQDVNAILKHTYNTAVRAQLISQRRDGCMVHPPPPIRILRPHMSIPVVMTSWIWRLTVLKDSRQR